MPTRRPIRRWSRAVTEHSNALDLEPGVFAGTPAQIARSLKRSAERSHRRKSSPFRSAMSMLTFYDPSTVALMYGGAILDDSTTVARLGIPENAQLALMPYNIIGG